jgi:hypothetical protein
VHSVELFKAEAHGGFVQAFSDDRAIASKTSGRFVILPFEPSARPYRRWYARVACGLSLALRKSAIRCLAFSRMMASNDFSLTRLLYNT